MHSTERAQLSQWTEKQSTSQSQQMVQRIGQLSVSAHGTHYQLTSHELDNLQSIVQ